jgi:hemerythrin-like metal-binding protein
MALVKWNTEMSVGIDAIDREHQDIIELLSVLHEAVTAGKSPEKTGCMLKDLLARSAAHFAHEEEFMRQHAHPDYDRHKAMHEEMTAQVALFLQKHDEGKLKPLEIFCLVTDWIKRHLLEEDKKIASCLPKIEKNGPLVQPLPLPLAPWTMPTNHQPRLVENP